MDRLNQLRGEAGGSRDSTLDTSSPPSEAFMTANESSSKYFSLSEVDSTFDISPIKDISLASSSVETEKNITEPDQLMSNLSPIGKKSDFDTYKIGKQIEAANILSGGVDIFDDNDNSYDGDELVIDDNAEIEEKSSPELKMADSQMKNENLPPGATLVESDAVPSKDTEVILQIDGKNADAIDIGNGLYLYRKEGQEELAAVQIIDDQSGDQTQPSFKFLKVRENDEGNLEVYEEIQIEVPKEVPVKEEKVPDKNVSHVPIKDISKVISDSSSNKNAERKLKAQNITKPAAPVAKEPESESNKEAQSECKSDSNVNKKMKFNESRKSPVVGSFTPMTFHSTPNKEGIPLTKTMVDLQLHPNRHSDNVKKTIEVHTDSVKQRGVETPTKQPKDLIDDKDLHTEIKKDLFEDKLSSPAQENKESFKSERTSEEKHVEAQSNIAETSKTSETNIQKTKVAIKVPNIEDKVVKENSDNRMIDSLSNVSRKIDFKDDLNHVVVAEEFKEIKESESGKTEMMEKDSKLLDFFQAADKPKSPEKSDTDVAKPDQPTKEKELQSEDKSKHIKLTEEQPKQIQTTDEKPKLTQFITEKPKHTQLNDGKSKQIKNIEDNRKSSQRSDNVTEQIKVPDDKPKQIQSSGDKAKQIQPTDDKLLKVHPIGDKPKQTQPTGDEPKQIQPTCDKLKEIESTDDKPKQTQVVIDDKNKQAKFSDDKPKQIHLLPTDDKLKQIHHSGDKPKQLHHTVDKLKQMQPSGEKPKQILSTGDKPKQLQPTGDKPKQEPKQLESTDDKQKQIQHTGDKLKHMQPSGEKPKQIPSTGDKPKQLQPTDDKQKQIQHTGDKPQQLQPTDDKQKQLQHTSEKPKPLQATGDKPKHLQPTGDKSKQIQPLAEKPKQIQPTNIKPNVTLKSLSDVHIEDKVKDIAKSDKCMEKVNLNPASQNKQEISKIDPITRMESELVKPDSGSSVKDKTSIQVESAVHISIDEDISKLIQKEEQKLSSTKDPEKKQLSSDSQGIDNKPTSKIGSHCYNPEKSKRESSAIIDVQRSVETEKVPEINKKMEKKEMQGAFNTKARSKQQQTVNEAKDNKVATTLQTDIKNPESKLPSKVTSNLVVNTVSSNVPKSSEPFKNTLKIQPFHSKDIEKEIKKGESKPVVKQQEVGPNIVQCKIDITDKKVEPKLAANTEQRPINNNHAPVPFGKWTDVNRQAFLNKIKETKVPTNSSNGKQIKNSNDLNRRDVLKKIDSQRQAQELANMNKLPVKKETAFTNKTSMPQDKPVVKTEIPILKNNSVATKKITKQEPVAKPQTVTTNTLTAAATLKKEATHRKEINNQDLIDKTIEGIINRAVPVKTTQEEVSQTVTKESSPDPQSSETPTQAQDEKINSQSLDEIEMKMNELHGIPFIERPAHELPHVPKAAVKSLGKTEAVKPPAYKPTKIPNLLPFVGKIQKNVKDNVIDVDSEEEIIEHEPITGDMDLTKNETVKFPISETSSLPETVTLISADSSKKETIITENDFDKFVRRNSINYENCITVSFDSKETHNVVQTIIQKDSGSKTYPKADVSDIKIVPSRKHEQLSQNSLPKPVHSMTKFGNIGTEDDLNKNYQSKVKMAYQTAMTAKRQLERPITIIEDRPVKVVYMDSNAEFISTPLNVQGKELSPAKKPLSKTDSIIAQASDSVDSDTLDSIEECKVLDETKVKTKHQRKQVLTPVETPELELIAPDDLGIEVSPKKKRRTEERVDKQTKTLVPKKSYLLGRGHTTDESKFDSSKSSQRESPKHESAVVPHKNTASAIDSLVKAAELLETQSVNVTAKSPDLPVTPDSQQNPPVKRGRGRPRKYPLPDGSPDKTKVPSPQKKPRLIDAKAVKNKDTDDEDDNDSTDDEMVKENWTMGKINENIVCPICNKLFRSENVVFKHVKHCTGPSPSRSDSDNKSPRRLRDSQESETKSFDSKSDSMDIEEETPRKDVRKKRKSRDTLSKTIHDKDEVIVIEDTPVKPKRNENKATESRKTINKNKGPDKSNSLVCEFCGKTFRQLSYLVNHKLQHGKDEVKKSEDESKSSKSVFSCEVCKKEFRKLHHLVQHRIIHNPSNATGKLSRKSSLEQSEHKTSKDQSSSKQNEDPSAGFRCEPCDKSFRKLHHLVEHRETHDGINRQKITSNVQQPNVEKLPPPPQCDICKKTFRKLHHLIEHKEQHLETLSEKSDDKSIKSSLSTKDIIHECSLCYMVFPNEHSLNKHTVICQRKKRQSATKQQKQSEEGDTSEGDKEVLQPKENTSETDDEVTIVMEDVPIEDKREQQEEVKPLVEPKIEENNQTEINPIKTVELNQPEPKEPTKIESIPEPIVKNDDKEHEDNLPLKIKKTEAKPKLQDAPKKKTPLKDKVAPTVTKRHKPSLPIIPVVEDAKPAEVSDDDEVRYMLNPDYKVKESEDKLFMKVRANKRNSLQIERPSSKDLVKRRISLQHPPKVPRLKQKPIQTKDVSNSTDSDDSDVKYSFPEPPTKESSNDSLPSKELPPETKESVKKVQKSLAEKRKSLSSIAKRKSLGKVVGEKHKPKSPLKQVRKRTADVEHRCDCGQLFSSAALLSRHTTLAHTPPRIRRRRSPSPEISTKTVIKPASRKSSVPVKTKQTADARKSSSKSDVTNLSTVPKQSTKRKSSINKAPNENSKSPKSVKTESVKSAPSNVKLRRYAAHKGRKVMEKSKK